MDLVIEATESETAFKEHINRFIEKVNQKSWHFNVGILDTITTILLGTSHNFIHKFCAL